MNASSIAGRIIPALFVHKCGIVNLNIVMTICMTALIYSLAVVKTTGGIVAFAIIYGFFQGGGLSAAQSYLRPLIDYGATAITLTPTMLG
jgi:MFS-type transporter involved in bile tolerance (Atg22 family)